MIYTVTLNPALDKTVEIPGMALDTVNRITEMRTDPGGKGINVSIILSRLGAETTVIGFLRASVDGAHRKVLHVHNIVKGRIECYRIDHGCFLSSTRSLKFMT